MKLAIISIVASLVVPAMSQSNSSYSNPMLPGWHSDPSCIYVGDDFEAFFCVTSTFAVTPGIPVYASKDLVNWKLASNALTRKSQVPEIETTQGMTDGIYAVTLRYHKGTFYAITTFTNPTMDGLLFKTTDPFRDDAWSETTRFATSSIDPDLFWDDDGQVYLTSQGVTVRTIDLETGDLGEATEVWNGTGGEWPEGPHIYQKDGFYYLMIAEGGTFQAHSVTIARSKDILGPYESYEGNPILTNRDTDEYIQSVGHADLFQAPSGDWWGVALATRSGSEYVNFPMGRETMLFPVTWEEGQWPVLQPVRGRMEGWPLPVENKDIGGKGPWLNDPDDVDFAPGSSIPGHFVYMRFPNSEDFSVSPKDHTNTLRLTPSTGNISANPPDIDITEPITLIMRRQTNTLFNYHVDVQFEPTQVEQETGVTLYLSQEQHIDLGIVMLEQDGVAVPHFRFRATVNAEYTGEVPETIIKAIPEEWQAQPIRLHIKSSEPGQYTVSATLPDQPDTIGIEATASGEIVTGGSGQFSGALVGVYATINGGEEKIDSYVSNWKYEGGAQYIDYEDTVPYTPYIFDAEAGR